jgi:hypothetical protein
LIVRKPEVGISAAIGPIHGSGQPARHGRNTVAVAAGRRISAFDGLDARGNESLEQPVDVFVELRILERDADLMAQGNSILQISAVEAPSVLLVEGL